MPTPLFDAILAMKLPRASNRLRDSLRDLRENAEHKELLEKLIFPEVVDALDLLAKSDEELDRGQVEVTVSLRRTSGGEWEHFGTNSKFAMARKALEDFVVMRLPFPTHYDLLENGEEVTIDDFSHGAVTGKVRESRSIPATNGTDETDDI